MSLTQYFRNNTGLPINKWAHYLPLYERYFSAFRNRSILFIEIGTGQGGSSRMWADYFGPLARIVTLDIREECLRFETEQIKVRLGDQADPDFLARIVDEFGSPDIVLDDGGHFMAQVVASFRFLFPLMSRDAIYMVEDLHTAYWPGAGGGLRRQGTFIEDMKTLIDEINSSNPHHQAQGAGGMPCSPIGASVRGLHFHESLVAIEKGAYVDKAERSIPLVSGSTIW